MCIHHGDRIEVAVDSVISTSSGLSFSSNHAYGRHKLRRWHEHQMILAFVGNYELGFLFQEYIDLQLGEWETRRWDAEYSTREKITSFYRDFLREAHTIAPPPEFECTEFILVYGGEAFVLQHHYVNTITTWHAAGVGAAVAVGAAAATNFESAHDAVEIATRYIDVCQGPIISVSFGVPAHCNKTVL